MTRDRTISRSSSALAYAALATMILSLRAPVNKVYALVSRMALLRSIPIYNSGPGTSALPGPTGRYRPSAMSFQGQSRPAIWSVVRLNVRRHWFTILGVSEDNFRWVRSCTHSPITPLGYRVGYFRLP